MKKKDLKTFLDNYADEYNRPGFIQDDPISVPHRFTQQQDIEIAGFFASILAWGNRKSIIQSCNTLLNRMDNQPYHFCINHSQKELKQLLGFKHRTFNDSDLLCLIHFFRKHYSREPSLESAFSRWQNMNDPDVEAGLTRFHNYVFANEEDFQPRTRKHIATPAKKSACKRLNMYLRWMVRNDGKGVDFGIWEKIKPAQLICPLDIHVARVARKFQLLTRTQNDWQAAVELTRNLKKLDAADPVKYDFALFGLGVSGKY
jgi:uncharacterized protein (TIGR02757 family)